MSNKASNYVGEQWAIFEENMVPKGASVAQHEDMKKAFYAGALVLLELATALGEPGVTEEEAMGILTAVTDELNDFMALYVIPAEAIQGRA